MSGGDFRKKASKDGVEEAGEQVDESREFGEAEEPEPKGHQPRERDGDREHGVLGCDKRAVGDRLKFAGKTAQKDRKKQQGEPDRV